MESNIEALGEIDIRPSVFIYTLCEPDTREVRYVGRTLWIDSRYDNHTTRSANRGVREWAHQLRRAGKRPLMVVVRRVEGWREGSDAEREEIARQREACGDRLFNYKAMDCGRKQPKAQRSTKPTGGRREQKPDSRAAKRQLILARMADKNCLRHEKTLRRRMERGSEFVWESDLKRAERETKKNRRLIRQFESIVSKQVADERRRKAMSVLVTAEAAP